MCDADRLFPEGGVSCPGLSVSAGAETDPHPTTHSPHATIMTRRRSTGNWAER